MKKVIAALLAVWMLTGVAFAEEPAETGAPGETAVTEAANEAADEAADQAAEETGEAAEKPAAPDVSVIPGRTVVFGHFEQDGSADNGAEPIEWQVLDTADGKALLVSRYGLDTGAYHKEWAEVTWEACSLRAWLNGDFLSSAFTAQEQGFILLTSVDNSAAQGNSRWQADGGSDTQDSVFLLSCAEIEKYFPEKVSRICLPTAVALKHGAYTGSSVTADGRPIGWWWLRSPGVDQKRAAYLHPTGQLDATYVGQTAGCIRPAMWVSLDAGIFDADGE